MMTSARIGSPMVSCHTHRQLAGNTRRTPAATIPKDFEEVVTGVDVKQFEPPVIVHRKKGVANVGD